MATSFTVRDLIRALDGSSLDDVVVIDNVVVTGVRSQDGRVREGHYNNSFKPHEDGRVTALRFTYQDELSDGSLIERDF